MSLNGPAHRRSALPGNLNVSFAQVAGEALLLNLKDIALSSGSACTSAQPKPSHVLRSLGLSEEAVGGVSASGWAIQCGRGGRAVIARVADASPPPETQQHGPVVRRLPAGRC